MRKLGLLLVLLFFILSCTNDDSDMDRNVSPKKIEDSLKKEAEGGEASSSVNLLKGAWKLDRFELISGKDKNEILHLENHLKPCDEISYQEFTSDNQYIIKTYIGVNGVCKEDKEASTEVSYKYDITTQKLNIEEDREISIVELNSKNLILEEVARYDLNEDGVFDIERSYYSRK